MRKYTNFGFDSRHLRLVLLVILACAACSFSVNLLSPAVGDVNSGDIVDLGTIGPGQTVSILIEPKVTTGGIHDIGGQYDEAVFVDMPRGWTSDNSKLYQSPMQVTLTADPQAKEGNYTAQIKVIDEKGGEGLGDVVFTVKLRVTYDVMDFDVSPERTTVGPGQPARFMITVTNKGSTSDAFEISSIGSKKWDFKKPVFVAAKSSKTIYYEVVGTEEETYQSTIKVVSLASDIISDEKNITMTIRSDLVGDYKATNHGVVLFPIFETPVYALAGLVSNLFG